MTVMKISQNYFRFLLVLKIQRHFCFSKLSPFFRSFSLSDKSYVNADYHCSSSDSDDEVIGQYQEAVSRSQGLRGGSAGTNSHHQKGYGWDTRKKYCPLAAEYDGYSSEASADDGKFIFHTHKKSLLCLCLLNLCYINADRRISSE